MPSNVALARPHTNVQFSTVRGPAPWAVFIIEPGLYRLGGGEGTTLSWDAQGYIHAINRESSQPYEGEVEVRTRAGLSKMNTTQRSLKGHFKRHPDDFFFRLERAARVTKTKDGFIVGPYEFCNA